MTSNIGEHFAERKKSITGFCNDAEKKKDEDRRDTIDGVVKAVFPPEFINRINAKVHYDFLTDEVMNKILDLELSKIDKRAVEQYGANLEFTPEARKYLIDVGFSKQYGARHLKRVLENLIQGDEKLIDLISEGLFVKVDCQGGKLVYEMLNLVN